MWLDSDRFLILIHFTDRLLSKSHVIIAGLVSLIFAEATALTGRSDSHPDSTHSVLISQMSAQIRTNCGLYTFCDLDTGISWLSVQILWRNLRKKIKHSLMRFLVFKKCVKPSQKIHIHSSNKPFIEITAVQVLTPHEKEKALVIMVCRHIHGQLWTAVDSYGHHGHVVVFTDTPLGQWVP